MASRLSRAWVVRFAVVAAAFALPLFAAGAAQAAIAGANPGVTTNAPDLQSATITANTTSTEAVQACFDKPLTSTNDTDFFLDGYGAGNYQRASSASVDSSNSKCADVVWDGVGDIDQDTILTALGGGATASAGVSNLDDSTTLNGSDTHSGTTGNSIAPDLTAVIQCPSGSACAGTNSLIYEFNKAVYPSSIEPAGTQFEMTNAAGSLCIATAASLISGTGDRDVVATFGTAGSTTDGKCFTDTEAEDQPFFSVADAIEGGAVDLEAYSDVQAAEPIETQGVTGGPGNDELTIAPYLVSAKLDPNNANAIDFTFNQDLTDATLNATDFAVMVSTGAWGPPTTATLLSGQSPANTVQVTFGASGLAIQNEYAVMAFIIPGAVSVTIDATSYANTYQSTPVGDNAGAFARGFTTAPDVTAVSFNTTSDVATVDVDQRLCSSASCANPGDILAYPATLPTGFGSSGGGVAATSVSWNASATAGPEALSVQFPSGTLAKSAFLQFDGTTTVEPSVNYVWTCWDLGDHGNFDDWDPIGALVAPIVANGQNNYCDPFSPPQIVAPISAAAIAKAIRHNKAYMRTHKGRKAKRARNALRGITRR